MEPLPSFEEWYRGTYTRVLLALLAVARSSDEARDATDEAFVRALERWPHVSGLEFRDRWTIVVGLNRLRRLGRRKGREAELLGVSSLSPMSDTSQDGSVLESWIESDGVLRAVRSLPERQRMAIALRYFADLPEAEIAQVMKVARGTVASTLADAKRRLAQLVAPEPEEA